MHGTTISNTPLPLKRRRSQGHGRASTGFVCVQTCLNTLASTEANSQRKIRTPKVRGRTTAPAISNFAFPRHPVSTRLRASIRRRLWPESLSGLAFFEPPLLLWEEYRAEHADGYGYSRFCDLYRSWRKTISPTMRQTHGPAEKLFVDFAGDTVFGVRRRDRCAAARP
jgi:hypothetical protein